MKRSIILSFILIVTIPAIAQEIIVGKYFTYETDTYFKTATVISINSATASYEGLQQGAVTFGFTGRYYDEKGNYINKIFCPLLTNSLSNEQLAQVLKMKLRMSLYFSNEGKILRVDFRASSENKYALSEEVLYQLYQNIMKVKLDMSNAHVDDRYLDKNGKYDYGIYQISLFMMHCD